MRIIAMMLILLLAPVHVVFAPQGALIQIKEEPTKHQTAPTSRSGFSVAREYIITAYTAGPESTGKRPGDKGYGTTASGTRVTEGRTCACPPSMPFGTKVYIEGVGIRICEDRGADIQGNRIDVYMESLQDALRYGRRTAKVRVIHEEKTAET